MNQPIDHATGRTPSAPLDSYASKHHKPPVISRLQGLFPRSHGATPNAHHPPLDTSSSPSSSVHLTHTNSQQLRTLKTRIVTWNMHDSVPKGDLEELFGKVAVYSPPLRDSDSFPQFPMNDFHPYHFVVVGGQECPSVSGIPMGLGAGFKLKDKEKDKDRDDKSDLSRHRSKHSLQDSEKDTKEHPGWTQMIEDWLCNASSSRARSHSSPQSSDISVPKPLQSSRSVSRESKRGPYQLLVKERMMGLYLAVYVHRDVRTYVHGVSKSAVTAGLIGGRLGNKGGVGVSVNVDGTTLLFMNCHLAAHGGRVAHRLANLAKIKAELVLEDYLPPSDPRVMAEDLTDKFDFSYIFGDLNFRLDIERLHADWLLSRKDYTQALTFDQLLNIMRREEDFVGFREAPILFAPTFKYDVLKSSNSKRLGLHRFKSQGGHERLARQLTEVQEREQEGGGSDDSEVEEGEVEARSIASTWTSMNDTRTVGDNDHDEDDEFFSSSNSPAAGGSKLSLSTAVVKVKSKWLSVMSPSSPASPVGWFRASDQSLPPGSPSPSAKFRKHKHSTSLDAPVTPGPDPNHSTGELLVERRRSKRETRSLHHSDMKAKSMEELANIGPDLLKPLPPPPVMERSMSADSNGQSSDEENSELGTDRGVYDSSSKRRVPSWCDRILYKTTIEPESDDDDTAEESSTKRGKVMTFFSQAFRSKRRVSHASLTSMTSSVATPVSPSPRDSVEDGRKPVGLPYHSTPPDERPNPIPRRHHMRRSSSYDGHPDYSYPSASTFTSETRHRSSTISAAASEDVQRRLGVAFSDSPPELPAINNSTSPIWRLPFMPALFSSGVSMSSRTNTLTPSTAPSPLPPITPPPPPPPRHRKGDVLCLKYDTLDDRGMKRLEGRSDHRPVIGSYAMYI